MFIEDDYAAASEAALTLLGGRATFGSNADLAIDDGLDGQVGDVEEGDALGHVAADLQRHVTEQRAVGGSAHREGRLELDGAFSNLSDVLKLRLSLEEGADGIAANLLRLPGRPPLALAVSGEGPLSDFAADIALASKEQSSGITKRKWLFI